MCWTSIFKFFENNYRNKSSSVSHNVCLDKPQGILAADFQLFPC